MRSRLSCNLSPLVTSLVTFRKSLLGKDLEYLRLQVTSLLKHTYTYTRIRVYVCAHMCAGGEV